MFFIMFLKQTTVKILIYTVKTKLRYSFFRLKYAKVIIKMINVFLVAGVKHLMVTHLSNNLNA